jgi:hypothetical protein
LIRKSRIVAALAAVLALGIAAVALADGASENSVGVLGKVSPTKLDKKTFKPVTFYTGVTTSTTHAVPGQQNAEKVQLDFGKNVKFDLKAADTCSAPITGTTTDQAKAACPPKSVIGSGVAHANLGGGPDQVSDVAVTVFNGPGPNHIRLHAFSPTLGAANTQVVDADIIKSPLGGKFGQALFVADAPDLGGDAFMLTLFDSTITKASKTVVAKCGKDKNFYWQNTTTYDDGSKDVSPLLTQPCKQKKSKH